MTDTMLAAGCKAVMVVPMTFTHEEHSYVVECHGDDFLICGSAEALDHRQFCCLMRSGGMLMGIIVMPVLGRIEVERLQLQSVPPVAAAGLPKALPGPPLAATKLPPERGLRADLPARSFLLLSIRR